MTTTQPLSLVLNKDRNALTGQINLSGWINLVADVSGTIALDGTMSLNGGNTWPAADLCTPPGGWHLTSWNSRYDSRTDTITGAFSFVTQKHLLSCYLDPNLMVKAGGLSLDRQKWPNRPFEGRWRGSYAIRACTPVGWPSCYPPPAPESLFDLSLNQNGTNVSGTLSWFPAVPTVAVGGNIGPDGVTLSLQGSQNLLSSGGTEVFRITAWSTTLDAIGRMQGTFSYVREVTWNVGPNKGSTYSTTYDADLRFVVRVANP